MSDFDEAYERSVAKVLSEHLERGVPDGTGRVRIGRPFEVPPWIQAPPKKPRPP